MFVGDVMSDSLSYRPISQRRSPGFDARRSDFVRNSTGLTDGFDAPTEAPTEWNHTGIEGVEGRDYEISVSGYRNYVYEMERMLQEEADSVRSLPRRQSSPRAAAKDPRTSSVHDSELGHGHSRHRSLRSRASKENLRQLAALNEGVDAIAQTRATQDGPSRTRTISLWRERVAQSQTGDDRRVEARGNGQQLQRRKPSSEALVGHVSASRTTGRSSGGGSKSKSTSKGSSGDYERTEYIISYQQPSRSGPVTQQVYTASEAGLLSPRTRRRGSSGSKSASQNAASASIASPRRSPKAYEHSEQYMMTYLHTPPHSQGSSRSSPKSTAPQNPPISPTHNGPYVPIDDLGGISRANTTTTASPIDLILSSCEPSLLHIGPVLSDLGICKMEHLRAVKRLTEETRNRELREPALKRGVTVMEWAILLDKILTL